MTPPLFPQETLKISDVGVMPVGAAAALVPPPAAPQVRARPGAWGPGAGVGWGWRC